MSFSVIFSKLKSLGPVLVVAGAVAITVKLLTTQAALNQEDLKVDAVEDIDTVAYEDKIELPKPEEQLEEKEEEAEKSPAQEQSPQEEESPEENSVDSENSSESQEEEEEKKQQEQKKEKPKSTPRAFKKNDRMANLFQRLLKPKQK